MADPTIQWLPPTDSTVGSILIYRATDNLADAQGTRSIIATVGTNVTKYTDTTGSTDNVYRIQFWNGIGSSPLSDPVSVEVSELLATFEQVRRLARINPQAVDIGSDDIYDAIKDATDYVLTMYGDPIKKSAIYVDSVTGSPYYDFTGDMGPVYMVRRITVGDTDESLVSGSSYSVNYRDGVINFASAFLSANQGQWVRVEWVPIIYNTMIKMQAAMDILESSAVIDGPNITNPIISRYSRTIGSIVDSLRVKGVYSSNTILRDVIQDGQNSPEWADYVAQRIDRNSLQFNDGS